jgi:hypothetical protein
MPAARWAVMCTVVCSGRWTDYVASLPVLPEVSVSETATEVAACVARMLWVHSPAWLCVASLPCCIATVAEFNNMRGVIPATFK